MNTYPKTGFLARGWRAISLLTLTAWLATVPGCMLPPGAAGGVAGVFTREVTYQMARARGMNHWDACRLANATGFLAAVATYHYVSRTQATQRQIAMARAYGRSPRAQRSQSRYILVPTMHYSSAPGNQSRMVYDRQTQDITPGAPVYNSNQSPTADRMQLDGYQVQVL